MSAPTAPPPPEPASTRPDTTAGHDTTTAPRAPARRDRTAWDVILGLVLVVVGLVILGDVVIASVLSVVFVGWTLLIGGLIAIPASLLRLGRGGMWIGVLDGVLSMVLGVVFLLNPKVTLLTLTLVAGALLVSGGVLRILLALQTKEQRLALLLSGVVTVVLGIMLLNRWPESAFWVLGTLLGVHIVIDGLLLMFYGRPRPVSPA